MTRKHFEAIASDIRQTRECIHNKDYYIVDALAQALALSFMQVNPRFDRERFLQACGITE